MPEDCIYVRDLKPIDLGFCPRCKSDWPMMTRVVDGVKFCHLCSFDVEENPSEKRRWVNWAKDYQKNMM